MIRNVLLMEAAEKKSDLDNIVKEIKKQMNVCKLTKFKSKDACSKFYSMFFFSTLEESDIKLTFEQWSTVYTTLLSDNAFVEDLTDYVVMYQPALFEGMFMSLWNCVLSELSFMKEHRVQYLSTAKAFISTMKTRFDAVLTVITSQHVSQQAIKFATIIVQVLGQMVFNMNTLITEEMAAAVKPDDTVQIHRTELSEAAKDLICIMEDAGDWIKTRENDILLDEGIVNNAKEKAKSAIVAAKKAQREFEEIVTRKIRKMREERRNRKHAEMVGEALRINHEIARLLKTGGIYLLSPAWAAIYFVISIIYDRATDKRDREVLVGQLKDELEIIEEKIAMADRNGDDKARIELIRFRQKLAREYERIQRMRWDPQTRGRTANYN